MRSIFQGALAAHPRRSPSPLTIAPHHRATTANSAPAHARSGTINLVQRFGSALNLSVHLHAIFLDGVYTGAGPYSPVRCTNPADIQLGLNWQLAPRAATPAGPDPGEAERQSTPPPLNRSLDQGARNAMRPVSPDADRSQSLTVWHRLLPQDDQPRVPLGYA